MSPQPPPRPTAPGDGFLVHVQTVLEILVVTVFIACFIVQPFRIPSESMLPTLRVGDFLLGNKQAFAPGGPLDRLLLPPERIQHGDLVIFHYPVDPSLRLIKRVIGLPGDHLRLHDGRIFLNGRPLAEPYAVYTPSPPNSFRDDFPSLQSADPSVDPLWWAQLRRNVADGEILVPPGHYFVMGDNRNDSEDSRYWGFVPRAAIVARPFLVYFSIAPPAASPAAPSAAPSTAPSTAPAPPRGFRLSLKAALAHARSTFRILR